MSIIVREKKKRIARTKQFQGTCQRVSTSASSRSRWRRPINSELFTDNDKIINLSVSELRQT